ncbi:MAG: hypothetical protein L0Z53_01395, partial [Acidobacteriales bacterium]|nr:hypothetical protein [Terriglobales bacterium]
DPARGRGRGRGERVERIAGFAMERALAQLDSRGLGGKASAKHVPGSIVFAQLGFVDDPWERWLSLRADLRRHVEALGDPARQAIALRYGLGGTPPLTCAAIAARLGMKSLGVVRLLARAQRELRAMGRRG